MNKNLIPLLSFFAGVWIMLFIMMHYGKKGLKPQITQAPCAEIHYYHRARDNRVIVCKKGNLILYNDNGYQGDSLRSIMIEEILEKL